MLKGIREVFVLAFLKVKTRQVILSPATHHPNETWVVAQAESFVKQARGNERPITYVQRNRDRKVSKSFDAKLKGLRVKIVPLNEVRCKQRLPLLSLVVYSERRASRFDPPAFSKKILRHSLPRQGT